MRGGLVSQADARFFGDALARGEGKDFCCLLPVLLDVVATAADAAAASGWPLQPFVSGESDVDSRRTKLIMPARLSSGPQRAWARARCAMPRVNLMALDEHPSCLHPRFGYARAFFPRYLLNSLPLFFPYDAPLVSPPLPPSTSSSSSSLPSEVALYRPYFRLSSPLLLLLLLRVPFAADQASLFPSFIVSRFFLFEARPK